MKLFTIYLKPTGYVGVTEAVPNVVQVSGIDYLTNENDLFWVIDIKMNTVFLTKWSNINYVLVDVEEDQVELPLE